MEENRSCKSCGAKLLEHEKRCPVCDMVQDDYYNSNIDDQISDIETTPSSLPINDKKDKKNYWKSPFIWTIAVILVIVSTVMSNYLNKYPIELAETSNKSKDPYDSSPISIKGETNLYAQATNNNMLGISYVSKDKAYIMMNQELLVYDKSFGNQELLFNNYLTAFSEDNKYYYYLNENNDYLRIEKESKKEDVLLTNVYYVHNLGNKVYYQKDSENESIHCLDLTTNEEIKINDEVSYSLIIDEKKARIFYVNKDAELISIALDGSDRKALASNTNIYTYDGKYLYYINNKGLIKCDLNGEHSAVFEKVNLSMVNIVDDSLVVHDDNIIYTMNRDGKNVKKLYTIETTGKLTFEVMGDKLLVLTSAYQEGNIGYEIVGLDGKRYLLESNNPEIIGEEI